MFEKQFRGPTKLAQCKKLRPRYLIFLQALGEGSFRRNLRASGVKISGRCYLGRRAECDRNATHE